jgi:hypothetical protein
LFFVPFFDRHEDRVPHLVVDGFGEVSLAFDVLDQDDFALPDLTGFPTMR